MVTINEERAMTVPDLQGNMCSYGSIHLDRSEWEEASSVEYSMDILSGFPLAMLINEGHVTHLELSGDLYLPKLQELNPFWIREVSTLGGPNEIIAESLEGAIFSHTTHENQQGVKNSVTLSLEYEGEKEELKRLEYGPQIVKYKILPDYHLCQELDISADIVSKLI